MVLCGPPGTIVGVVQDDNGHPAPGCTVALLPDDREKENLVLSRVTDANGAFQFESAPGHFHLYSWGELEGSAYRNAEFMKSYDSLGAEVEIQKGRTQRIQLHMLR